MAIAGTQKARPETIALIGVPCRKEGIAKDAVRPGEIIEYVVVSDKLQIQKLTTAGSITNGPPIRIAVAFENEFLGKTIDDAYTAGDQAYYGVFDSGDVCQMRLGGGAVSGRTATSYNIAIGDKLVVENGGHVRKWLPADAAKPTVVGYALGAIDNQTATNDDAFIKVEVR